MDRLSLVHTKLQKKLLYAVVQFNIGHNGHVKSMYFFLLWFTPNKKERGIREGVVPAQHSSWGTPGTAYAVASVLPSQQESVMNWQKVVVPFFGTWGHTVSLILHSSAAQSSQISPILAPIGQNRLHPFFMDV